MTWSCCVISSSNPFVPPCYCCVRACPPNAANNICCNCCVTNSYHIPYCMLTPVVAWLPYTCLPTPIMHKYCNLHQQTFEVFKHSIILNSISLPPDSDVAVPFSEHSTKSCAANEIGKTKTKSVCKCLHLYQEEDKWNFIILINLKRIDMQIIKMGIVH